MFSLKEIEGKTTLGLIQTGINSIIEKEGILDSQLKEIIKCGLIEPKYMIQTLFLLKKLHDYCDKGIHKNNTHALYTKGYLYECGLGCEKNNDNAIELLDKAVEKDYLPALNSRALMHRNGQNHPEAIKLFNKAISLGDGETMYHRARMHLNFQGSENRIADAIALLKKAIELGNGKAMTELGYLYDVVHDYPKAIELYDKAILLGEKTAMDNRALMYAQGVGGDINYIEAIKLFDKAIALGSLEAMHNRANMHVWRKGGACNIPEAVRLYEQAIAHNFVPSMMAYAELILRTGIEGKHDRLRLLRRAAELGNKEALELIRETATAFNLSAHHVWAYHHAMLTNDASQAAEALIDDERSITELLAYDCKKDLTDTKRRDAIIKIFEALRAQSTDDENQVNTIFIKCLNYLSRKRKRLSTVASDETKALLEIELVILDSISFTHLEDSNQANLLLNYIVELYYLLEPDTFVEKAYPYINAILMRLMSLSYNISETEEARNIAIILVKSLLGPDTEITLSPHPIPSNTLCFLSTLKGLGIPLSIKKINDFLETPFLTDPQKRQEAQERREALKAKNTSSHFFTKTGIDEKKDDLPMDVKQQILP